MRPFDGHCVYQKPKICPTLRISCTFDAFFQEHQCNGRKLSAFSYGHVMVNGETFPRLFDPATW